MLTILALSVEAEWNSESHEDWTSETKFRHDHEGIGHFHEIDISKNPKLPFI